MAYNKSDRDGGSDFRRRGPRRRKKVCAFCADKNFKFIDYKDINKLKRFMSERALTVAIKRSRHIALMPYTLD